MFYKVRRKVIKLFDDYSVIIPETTYASFHGKKLKILFPKEIFQRLSIALAQLEAGKEITKKLYNNIANSIKL